MSKKPQPMPTKKKAPRFSEWAHSKNGDRYVTRGEFLNVFKILTERRFMIEHEIARQRKWRIRLWYWFTNIFTGERGATAQEIQRAIDQVNQAQPDSPNVDSEDEEDRAEEGGQPQIEAPPEIIGDGVKFRDKRKREVDQPVTDAEGAE